MEETIYGRCPRMRVIDNPSGQNLKTPRVFVIADHRIVRR
jgi:hypothetical protein